MVLNKFYLLGLELFFLCQFRKVSPLEELYSSEYTSLLPFNLIFSIFTFSSWYGFYLRF